MTSGLWERRGTRTPASAARGRRTEISEAANLLADLVREGNPALAFIRSRREPKRRRPADEVQADRGRDGELKHRVAPTGLVTARRAQANRRLAAHRTYHRACREAGHLNSGEHPGLDAVIIRGQAGAGRDVAEAGGPGAPAGE